MAGTHICLVRRGHMGDVLLTEPIARALRTQCDSIVLCTEFEAAGRLLPIYDAVLPYEDFINGRLDPSLQQIVLVYEIYPGCHHLDGFARYAGVSLASRIPQIRKGSKRPRKDRYALIAPHTSSWIQRMRQWPTERFIELTSLLSEKLNLQCVMLDPSHSFQEMVALTEHCEFFVGNDSGPGILAQCFRRHAYIIFGATHPDRVLIAPEAHGIASKMDCIGCKHFARHTDIECASPLCLEELQTSDVLALILKSLR